MSDAEKFPPIEWPADSEGPLTHPDLPYMELRIVRVTPDIAQTLLDHSIKKQRNISPPTERTYANDMRTGFWAFLGDPIRIDINGAVVDGQHRATAIIRSGKAQLIVIITGLAEGVMRYVDTGRKRTYADTLKMREIANHLGVATVVSAMFSWYNGSYGEKNTPRLHGADYNDARASNAQLDAVYDLLMDKEIDPLASVQAAERVKFHIMSTCPRSAISVAHVLMGLIDPYSRDTFFAYVLNSEVSQNTTSEFPPNMLRDKMIRSKQGKPDYLTRAQWLHMIITAYNAWVQGRTIGRLLPPSTPVRPESWAYPYGLAEVAGSEEI
jgi:hypothetical protein